MPSLHVNRLLWYAVIGLGLLTCSDPTRPSSRFFDACTGRVAQNHIILNVSPSPDAGALGGSDIQAYLQLTRTDGFNAQCGQGTAEIVLIWPGRPTAPETSYAGEWSPSQDQLWIDFDHPEGEWLLIRLFPDGMGGVWTMINSAERTKIGGSVRLN